MQTEAQALTADVINAMNSRQLEKIRDLVTDSASIGASATNSMFCIRSAR